MTSAWDYAAAAWGRPGVEAACLDLQAAHGQCVALLLWRLWAASEGRDVASSTLESAIRLARDWDVRVLTPLRAARDAVRDPVAGINQATRENLRRQLLGTELEAERALLAALDNLTPAKQGDPAVSNARQHLVALTALWGTSQPIGSLNALLDALQGRPGGSGDST